VSENQMLVFYNLEETGNISGGYPQEKGEKRVAREPSWFRRKLAFKKSSRKGVKKCRIELDYGKENKKIAYVCEWLASD